MPIGIGRHRLAEVDDSMPTRSTQNAARNRGGTTSRGMTSKSSDISHKSSIVRKPSASQPSFAKAKTKPFSERSFSTTTASMGNNSTRRKPASRDKENLISGTRAATDDNTKKVVTSSTQPSRTKKTMSNRKVTFTPVTKNRTAKPARVSINMNSLRRSLRDSVTPPSQKCRKTRPPKQSEPLSQPCLTPRKPHNSLESHNTTALILKVTPLAQNGPRLPKTPKSILQEQLEITMDESLLVSPASETNCSNLHSYLQTTESPSPGRSNGAESSKVFANVAGSKLQFSAPEGSPKCKPSSLRRSVFSATEMNVRSIIKNNQTPARQAGHALPLKGILQAQAHETPCDVQHAAKAALPKSSLLDTPTSKHDNGVCLDLTALFVKEQKTVRKGNRNPAPDLLEAKEEIATVPSDDRWAEMQCQTFSKWLNFVLDPTEDSHPSTQSIADLPTTSVNATESSNRPALRTLMLHQDMAKARSAATDLFQSYEMKRICSALDAELEKGKLSIRGDRDMHSDLTCRKNITSLLMSYSTPWLRLGLETLFGETIMPEMPGQYTPTKLGKENSRKTPAQKIRAAVRSFIINRLISDAAVLAKYTKGRCKVPSGNFEKRYRAEMRKLVLRRILILVFFLDRAKQANLLHSKASRLFTKAANVKSSRDVLISFCRDFLASEGDITKHLGRVSLKVFYKQESIEEIDMRIVNFAVDLRDGVRLAKIAQILVGKDSGKRSLLDALRVPGISRLQKLHNVGVALGAFRNAGVGITDDVSPHHIVDGHRSMVLKLMWAVIAHYSFPAVLDVAEVEAEIQNLRKAMEPRNLAGVSADETSSNELEDKREKVLMRWCQAVCALFGLPISDFSTSFADGKALCFMVHYYHPGMLSIKEIRPTSRDLASNRRLSIERARYNEKLNSTLAHMRLSELGGIPSMMPTTDTTMVPDSKSMMVYLSYACSRLLASRSEVQAILKIQIHCRAFLSRCRWVKQAKAGAVIIQVWRHRKEFYFRNQRMKYKGPVTQIEAFVGTRLNRLKRLRVARKGRETIRFAVLKIQSRARLFLAKKRVFVMRSQVKVAINLQQWFRHKQTVKRIKLQASLIQCQRFWRGYASRRQSLVKLSCIILLQAIGRSWITRRHCVAAKKAASCIQRFWRSFWAQLQYQIDLLDIVAVQSVARRKLAIRQRVRSLQAVGVIQLASQRYLTRCNGDRQRRSHEAATVCQRHIRGYLGARITTEKRIQFVAATILQREWRAITARRRVGCKRLAAVCIQSFFRAAKVEQKYNSKRLFAVSIQMCWRKHWNERNLFNAVLLQKHARSWAARRGLERCRISVCLIQRSLRRWRGKRLARERRHLINSVVSCQSFARSYLARKHHKMLREGAAKHTSAIVVQALCRRYVTNRRFETIKFKVIRIQAWWRCLQTSSKHRVILWGIIKDQALVRGFLSRKNTSRKITLNKAVEAGTIAGFNVSQAARTLQKSWRANYQISRFNKIKFLATRISGFARGRQARLELRFRRRSALKIQSVYRHHVARRGTLVVLKAPKKLQNAWRSHCETSKYMRTKHAANVIQQAARSFLCRRKESQLLVLMVAKEYLIQRCLELSESTRTAVVCIQTRWRSHEAKRYYEKITARVVCLQASFRQHLAQKRYEKLQNAVVYVQSLVRRRRDQQKLTSLKQAVARLLSLVQLWLAKKRVRALRQRKALNQKAAALILQKQYRGYCSRVRFQLYRSSAAEIQKVWRGFLCFEEYTERLFDIALVQSLARRWLAMQELDRRLHAIICIQSFGRMLCSKHEALAKSNGIKLVHSGTVCIQRVFRGRVARKWTTRQRAARAIQKLWRAYTVHVDFMVKVLGMLQLQSVVRMRSCKCLFLQQRFSATQIQRTWRAKRVRINSCLYIQRHWRKSLVQHRKHQNFCRAAVKMQQLVRGHWVRQRTWQAQKVRITAARLKEANLRATKSPKLQLRARTLAALDVLQSSKSLAELMAALCTLEMSTRFSQACCVSFAHAKCQDVLFGLIRQCNRSRPHVQLLTYIVLTLRNVAQYDTLLTYIAVVPRFVDVLLDLVQQFRDKDEIFSIASPLLERCIKFDEEVKKHCGTHEHKKRLKGVYSLCKRKVSSSSRASSSGKLHLKKGRSAGNEGLAALGRIIQRLDLES